jgi:hypothetical protein
MATITKPTAFAFAQLQLGYRFAQGVSVNPYTIKTRVKDWGGKVRVLSVSTPPLGGNDVAAWTAFIEDLRGSLNTFTIASLSTYFPHETATNVSFRMIESPQWSVVLPNYISLSFEAIEAL